MLLSNEFVKAQHEYKREELRKSYNARATTKVEKATVALVVSLVTVMALLTF